MVNAVTKPDKRVRMSGKSYRGVTYLTCPILQKSHCTFLKTSKWHHSTIVLNCKIAFETYQSISLIFLNIKAIVSWIQRGMLTLICATLLLIFLWVPLCWPSSSSSSSSLLLLLLCSELLDADPLEGGLSAGLWGGDSPSFSLGLLSTTSACWGTSAAGLVLSSDDPKATQRAVSNIETASKDPQIRGNSAQNSPRLSLCAGLEL